MHAVSDKDAFDQLYQRNRHGVATVAVARRGVVAAVRAIIAEEVVSRH
jgi:hypothetical protein